jgi:hypothetical protein
MFFSSSYAQNKKPILSKKVKTVKKYRIKKRVSDSTLTTQTLPPSSVIPEQKENNLKKPNQKFRTQKTLLIASNQTESNCAGAFFRHAGLYIKYSKEDKEWTLLCEGIIGFNYEKGYGYEIVVNIYDIDYGSAGCEDDCPRVKYELVKIVSKKIPK